MNYKPDSETNDRSGDRLAETAPSAQCGPTQSTLRLNSSEHRVSTPLPGPGPGSNDVVTDDDPGAEVAWSPSGDRDGRLDDPVPLVRLQKVLAAAGVGSRRTSEQLIASGRVVVDGRVVDQLGARVNPDTAVVMVDGRRVSVRPGVVHLALNKPRGMLSAMSDDRGRPTVGDLVRDRPERLFHVGRLDADSEGLLLLTNDGEFAHQLMHPSYGVRKTYLVEVDGTVPRASIRQLLAGVDLEDGPARADAARVIQSQGSRTLIEIELHEGRKRIVRRMFAAVGYPVQRLVRTAIGGLQLGGQRAGTLRTLTPEEVTSLYTSMDLATNH